MTLKIYKKEIENGVNIHYWKCPICDKIISGVNKKQVEFNRDLHYRSCEEKQEAKRK